MNSNIISQYGIFSKKIFWNLNPKELEEISIRQNTAQKTDLGAISVNTGKFPSSPLIYAKDSSLS